jgi:hypothetical protein
MVAITHEVNPNLYAPDLWSPEYLSREFAAESIKSLMHESGDPKEPFGVYLINGGDPRSSLGRIVELERFEKEFGNGPEFMKQLYGEFEEVDKTKFIVVVDHNKLKPAGVIRTVKNSEQYGCRILNDMQKHGDNGWGLSMSDILQRSKFAAQSPEEILDIPTIAVSEDYAGAKDLDSVSKALCAGVFQMSLNDPEVKTWVCSLARVPYILIQAYTSNCFSEFDGVPSQPYYGDTDTTPLWCNVIELADRIITEEPDIYARYHDNVGLENYFFAQ